MTDQTTPVNEIADRIAQLAAGTFGVERASLSPTTTADDVESWDSFAQLNLMVAIEDEFEIELDPEQINDLSNLGALTEWVAAVVGS